MDGAQQRRVVVVGAGIAGLMCAKALAGAGVDVVVVDKGRGVGGRMATRRFAGAVFDHGAQYFTARPPWFASEVLGWESAGVVARWFDAGEPAWRGVPSMTGIAKHLAKGLDVRLGMTVSSVSAGGPARWTVVATPGVGGTDGAEQPVGVVMEADAVVITAPVPQGLAMLDAGGVVLAADVVTRLDAVSYDPCLAVLAVFDGPTGMVAPGWQRAGDGDGAGDSDGVVAWVADNQLKGVSELPALTLHCTTEASRAMFDDDADDVIAAVLAAATSLPGRPGFGREVVASQLVRWRYARVATADPGPCLITEVDGAGPLVVAGDGFGGPRVESAAASGVAAADALVAQWSGD
jgi:renalase